MKPKILVVDDSLTVRMDIKEALESGGFSVSLSGTAGEMRAALVREQFGLIVLDVVLPDADGVELLKDLRGNSATAGIPVMFLSTKSEVQSRLRGLSGGADEYLGKPYDRSELISRAKSLVRSPEPATGLTPTVLIIDDSLTLREKLHSMLQATGYQVLLAESGEQGLRMAVEGRPAAVIVDGKLPGIDGPTVIRRLRSDVSLRRTPCILLTGSADPNDEFAALESGADAFVRKDEDEEVFLARFSSMFRTLRIARKPAEKSFLSPKKVLAVDDSPTYLHGLSSALREDGYEVVEAESGEEALEVLQRGAVDCVLLDLLMPGLSGHETCRRIRGFEAGGKVPLMILTAKEDREAMLESFNAGADDYVPKSSEIEVLKARLRSLLRRKQFEEENDAIREELYRQETETREARAAKLLAQVRAELLEELEHANKELEAFSYSVSHDLSAPLRMIDGFSLTLLEEYGRHLDERGREQLQRVRLGCQRMRQLIDDLLNLSHIGRMEMKSEPVNLSSFVRELVVDFREREPGRRIDVQIQDSICTVGDKRLLKIVFENLLSNAWKFTSKVEDARVTFGVTEQPDGTAYFVRDNGAGFDMAYVEKLFNPFQRLHGMKEFPGSGIGLSIVQRIVSRHGGRVWAESGAGGGATFYFTLGDRARRTDPSDLLRTAAG